MKLTLSFRQHLSIEIPPLSHRASLPSLSCIPRPASSTRTNQPPSVTGPAAQLIMIFHHCHRNLCSVQFSSVQFGSVWYRPVPGSLRIRIPIAPIRCTLLSCIVPLPHPTASPTHLYRIPTASPTHPYRIPTTSLSPHIHGLDLHLAPSERKGKRSQIKTKLFACLICCSCITSPHLRSRNSSITILSMRPLPSFTSVHFLGSGHKPFCFVFLSLGFRSLSFVHDPLSHSLAS